ncbi:MAG: hypothetical protein ACKOZW_08495 [Cyanobium sp.]
MRADAGRFLTSAANADLQAEIDSLSTTGSRNPSAAQQARLEDLKQLAAAIARSDDRAQLRNDSTHNIGLFLRYKKDPPGAKAALQILGPSQEIDDDFELVGLYVPAGVTLAWDQDRQPPGGAAAAPGPRVARVLEGQRLHLADVPAAPETPDAKTLPDAAVGYSLNLPIFALLEPGAAAALVADIPNLSQVELDGQRPNAPTD